MVSKTFAKAYAPVYPRHGTALFASAVTMLRHDPHVIAPVIATSSRSGDACDVTGLHSKIASKWQIKIFKSQLFLIAFVYIELNFRCKVLGGRWPDILSL